MKLALQDLRPSLPMAVLLTAALVLPACDRATSTGGPRDADDARPAADAGATPDARNTDDPAPTTNRDGAGTPPDQRPRDAGVAISTRPILPQTPTGLRQGT